MIDASLRLEQKSSMVQKLIAAIINKPISVIDRTIDAIIENPNIVNSGAQSSQDESKGIRLENYFSLLERLISIENDSGTTNGVGQSIPISENARTNSDERLAIQPDISYVVRACGEFSIGHSEYLNKMEPELRVSQVPTTLKPFLRWLIKERNWMAYSLLQAYNTIGRKQAGFLFYLEPQHLVILPLPRLSSETGTNYTPGIYSRLLQGRNVGIESPNGTVVLPVAFLLPSQDSVMKYNVIPIMNVVFEEEFARKRTYSDNEIRQKIQTIARKTMARSYEIRKKIETIALRTIAKYRLSAGIPDRNGRLLQYAQGMLKPYKITMAIEAYLPNR